MNEHSEMLIYYSTVKVTIFPYPTFLFWPRNFRGDAQSPVFLRSRIVEEEYWQLKLTDMPSGGIK